MNYIQVNLFGSFMVTLNGGKIIFPFSKIKALFCYLIVRKEATRDELSALLWPDMEDEIAKKNLRNAIYKLKKSFGEEEVICFSDKSTIILNPNMSIESDYDRFVKSDSETDVCSGEFLQGYTVKDAENFERWMFETREYLKEMYLKRLNEQMELARSSNNNYKIEKCCKSIIKIDEFNEGAYRNLICCYKNQAKYTNAIKVYDELSDILNQELSITPEVETERVFKEVLDEMGKRQNQNMFKGFFYGRFNELRLMENNFQDFMEGANAKSILVKGEMGIGKTTLKDHFLQLIKKENVIIYETNCYQFEEQYILKPFKNIILNLVSTVSSNEIKIPMYLLNLLRSLVPEINNDNLDNMNFEDTIDFVKHGVIEDTVVDILKRISAKKKVLLVFEDIQWMDSSSMSLLINIISHSHENNILFLLTSRNETNPCIERFLVSASQHNEIETIEVKAFSNKEIERFINRALPGNNISKEIIDKIYSETEGNAFFLTEYLNIIKSKRNINIMTSKMQDVLKSRFVDLPEEEKKIVEIASLFCDEVPMLVLEKLTQKDELEILDSVEQLEKKWILKEIFQGSEICFTFTHQKLREFQYMNLSNARKKILHNRVGQVLEQTLKNDSRDIDTHYKLIYHFQSANNYKNCLKYQIKSLNAFLNFVHVRFPIINYDEESYSKLYLSEDKTTKKLNEVESLLAKIKNEEGDSTEVLRLEVYVLHIKGRYLIRKGIYTEGVECIKDMIDISQKIDYIEYILEGYEQMIWYCIQTENAAEMSKYIEYSFDLIEKGKCHKEKGILIRYKALYEKMIGEYYTAEKLMEECIKTLSRTKSILDQYSLNIAACYNDIGDIRKNTGDFKEALAFYKKAIDFCKEKNIWISISLFQTNAGEAAYHLGDYINAREFFENALEVYGKVADNMGESIAEAYMSMISIKERKFEDALKYLNSADVHSQVLKNPKELEIVSRVKSEIKLNIKGNI